MHVSMLSGYRTVAPFALEGGSPGMTGRNTIRRASGAREDLGGCGETNVAPGDAILIETPTGGGFGRIP